MISGGRPLHRTASMIRSTLAMTLRGVAQPPWGRIIYVAYWLGHPGLSAMWGRFRVWSSFLEGERVFGSDDAVVCACGCGETRRSRPSDTVVELGWRQDLWAEYPDLGPEKTDHLLSARHFGWLGTVQQYLPPLANPGFRCPNAQAGRSRFLALFAVRDNERRNSGYQSSSKRPRLPTSTQRGAIESKMRIPELVCPSFTNTTLAASQ